jgi:hypothetical protein
MRNLVFLYAEGTTHHGEHANPIKIDTTPSNVCSYRTNFFDTERNVIRLQAERHRVESRPIRGPRRTLQKKRRRPGE